MSHSTGIFTEKHILVLAQYRLSGWDLHIGNASYKYFKIFSKIHRNFSKLILNYSDISQNFLYNIHTFLQN